MVGVLLCHDRICSWAHVLDNRWLRRAPSVLLILKKSKVNLVAIGSPTHACAWGQGVGVGVRQETTTAEKRPHMYVAVAEGAGMACL